MSKTDINKKNLVEQNTHETDVSVYAYDRAIVEDFRARFRKQPVEGNELNNSVQIAAPTDVFDIYGQMNDDQVVMPFVSLQRLDWQLNLDRQGYQTFIGDKIEIRESNDGLPTEARAQVIPITINYQLSVWSTDRITNDALMEELLFYYHLRPSLLVYVGKGLNIEHKFNIYFNSGIEDNSDIANHLNKGKYFRQDITFYTDDAYLWRANYKPLVEVLPGLNFNYGSVK